MLPILCFKVLYLFNCFENTIHVFLLSFCTITTSSTYCLVLGRFPLFHMFFSNLWLGLDLTLTHCFICLLIFLFRVSDLLLYFFFAFLVLFLILCWIFFLTLSALCYSISTFSSQIKYARISCPGDVFQIHSFLTWLAVVVEGSTWMR